MSLRIHIGASGMGKTHALARVVEQHAAAGWICVVVDPKREWGRHSRQGVLVSGPKGAARAVKSGARILVWSASDAWGDMPDADAACAWVLDRGHGTLIAIPEAHLYYPLHQPLPRASVEVLTGYRHRGISVLLDTQRLASLSTMPRNNADLVRVFGVVGKRDLAELAEWGGPMLATAAVECARRRRLLNERGWHIPFDPYNPGGPYKLERFPA